MFYFSAQPRGMKYAFEAMHFITFVIYSEHVAHHILHGQFVNPKGGEGNDLCGANDL